MAAGTRAGAPEATDALSVVLPLVYRFVLDLAGLPALAAVCSGARASCCQPGAFEGGVAVEAFMIATVWHRARFLDWLAHARRNPRLTVCIREVLGDLFLQSPDLYATLLAALAMGPASSDCLCVGLQNHPPCGPWSDASVRTSLKEVRKVMTKCHGAICLRIDRHNYFPPGNASQCCQQLSDGPLLHMDVRFKLRGPAGHPLFADGLQVGFFPWPPVEPLDYNRVAFELDEDDFRGGSWQEFRVFIQEATGKAVAQNLSRRREEALWKTTEVRLTSSPTGLWGVYFRAEEGLADNFEQLPFLFDIALLS